MELRFTAGIDRNQFKSDIDAMRRDILGLNNTVKSETSKMDSAFKNLSLGIAGYFSVNAVQGFVRELINVRGEFQKTEIAFTTMLGNADQAKSLMNDMVNLAAKTPFSLQDVSSGAKQLLAFQVPANEVVDTLTRLGNIAAGLSVPLERINLIYGQVKAKGKLTGDDLRQFTEAGIPMVAELAKKFGTTTSAITEMVSAGKIGFKDVQDVLFSMTNEGGMFFNLMEKQSKSLSGQIANLGDAWAQMLNKIGEANDGILSNGIQGLTYLVQHYEDVIQVVGTLVATYGAYKAALIAANALQGLQIVAGNVIAFLQLAKSVRTATEAQILFNIAAGANPYVLVAAGIAAVVGALVYFNTGTKEASNVTKELNAQLALNKDISEAAGKAYNENSGKLVSSLDKEIQVLKSSYSTLDMRKKAYESLIKINSAFIGTVDSEYRATSKLTAVYNSHVNALKEIAIAKGKAKVFEQLGEELAKTQLEKMLAGDSLNKAKKTNKVTKKIITVGGGQSFNTTSYEVEVNSNQKQIDERSKILKDATKKEQELNKKLQLLGEDRVKAITILQAQTRGGIENGRKLSKQEIEAKKEALKFYKGASDEQVATINNSTENLKKANDKNNAEVEKLYGEDTIKGLQQRISKLNEVMETSVFGSKKYNAAKSQKEALEARLKEMTASFDDEIAEIKRQTEVRDKLLQAGHSKETVDAMFPKIADKSYKQILEDTSNSLQNLINTGNGTKETADNLKAVNDELDRMNNIQSKMDIVKERIDTLNNKFSGTQLLDKLEESRINSLKNSTEQEKVIINKAYDDARELAIKAQQDKFNALLEEQRSYEEKSLALQKEYDAMRALAKTDAEKEKVDKSYSKKFTDLFFEQMQGSEEFGKVFIDMNEVATEQLEKFKIILQQKLSEAKTIEEKIKIGEFIKKIEQAISGRNFIPNFSRAIEALGDDSLSTAEKIKIAKEEIQKFQEQLGLAKEIISGVSDIFTSLGGNMDSAFGDILNNLQQTISGLEQFGEGAFQAIEGFASGNILQAAAGTIKAIGGAIKSVSGWISGDNKKERQIKAWAEQVANLKVQYQELERAMNKALGDDKYKNQQEQIANLERQKILLQQMIKKEEDKKKTDKGKIKDWQQQISDINNQISDIKDNIVNNILQIDVKGLADKIGDALIEGFGRGEDALASLNKTADEVFKDMVKNALKMQLEKNLQPVLSDMLKAMGYTTDSKGNPTGSFDGLTPEERDALKAKIIAATGDYQKAMEQYADLFGSDAANSPNGLKGDIKGITEKTAGALESQINAIRIYQVEALNISKRNQQIFLDALKYQAEIAYNTRPLFQIQKDIAELNSKVKKPLAGL